MQGGRAYTIAQTAIFTRCEIFPYTRPYITREDVEERRPFSRFLSWITAAFGAHSSLLTLVSVRHGLVLVDIAFCVHRPV